MDNLSPVSTKTSRRSRYSLYQSDYETAGEESDNSLYYSVLDDEDNENKENSINTNVNSTRRSLFARCLQNQLNHTPRNEFNKRVLINPLVQSTTSSLMTNTITAPDVVSSVPKIDVSQELSSMIESHENLSHSMTSLQLEKPNSIENTAQVVDSKNNASTDEFTNIASDMIINDDNDQSLNNTIVAISDKQTASPLESSTQAPPNGIHKDTSAATATSNENQTATEIGSQASNDNISITFGLSNLSTSRKMTIIASSTSDSTNAHVFVSNIPTNPRLLIRAQSTESNGISKPKGKTGIPRVSMIGTNNMGSSQSSKTSTVRSSIIPIFSQKCKYCDKSFAKKNILDTHLLEKCEKIPATRQRQLVRSQSNSTNNY